MRALRRGSRGLIREINESIVLAQIRTHPLSSRTTIAGRTGLSLPTVSDITGRLLRLGIVEERQTGESRGGRRPVLLALRPDAGFAVGIKATEQALVAVLTDLEATVVERVDVPLAGVDIAEFVSATTHAVDRLRPVAGPRPIHGVGVGLAGVVDRDKGIVRHATYTNWQDVELARILEDHLDLHVIVDNDVNALVSCEQWFGAGRGAAHFVVVSIGRGVGLGLVLGGQLYRGHLGGAGEFGHMKVAAGPTCACGGAGCLEAVASDTAILAEVRRLRGRATGMATAIRLAEGGDRRIRNVFARAGRTLGTAVGNLVNLLNPELVILAGEGTAARHLLMPAFDRALRAAVFSGLEQELRVVVDDWDDEAWARGAASLLLAELFSPRLSADDAPGPSLTPEAATR